jgi:HNH endonuclease
MEHRRGVELTDKQKNWVRDRDDNRCNFPTHWTDSSYDRCGRRRLFTEVHVHHIVPYSWAARRLLWTPEEINNPYNLITLCKNHHFAYVHGTDMRDIFQKYRDNKDAYREMFARRRKLTDEGIPYWDTQWDDIFKRIAEGRTDRYVASTAEFPMRRIRRLT